MEIIELLLMVLVDLVGSAMNLLIFEWFQVVFLRLPV